MKIKFCLIVICLLTNSMCFSQSTKFAEKFSNAENDSLFILNYPNATIEKFSIDAWLKLSESDSIIFSKNLKEIIGPIKDGEKTYYLKITKIDSAYKVHVGNIWLSKQEMDSIKRYKIANEILLHPDLFDKYCHKYSDDKNKAFECEVPAILSYAYVEPYASETARRKKGEIYIVETKFGTHIVKSLDDPIFTRSKVEYILLTIN